MMVQGNGVLEGSLRLAYFSPLPPNPSGIADYSRELLPHLDPLAAITLFTQQTALIDPILRERYPVNELSSYPAARWDFDLALYQMGNSTHHETIYPLALRYPGLVILHDHGLHHFVADMTSGKGNYAAYAREIAYGLGSEGQQLAWEMWLGSKRQPLYTLPLNRRLIDRSLGLIVHSQTAANLIHQVRPSAQIRVIPHEMLVHRVKSRRTQLEIPGNTIIFASAGQVTSAKRLDMALSAFARLLHDFPNAIYLVIGQIQSDVDLSTLVRRLGIQDKVKFTGRVPELETFMEWISTADVIVNLRHPTLAETSGPALRAMATGRPLIVFDHGWYGELPDDACLKVAPLDEKGLYRAMQDLAGDPEKREALGRQAMATIRAHHHPAQVAGAYMDFVGEVLSRIHLRLGGS